MKIAIYEIAHKLGMHPAELGKAIRNGDVTGEVPGGNAQAKDAWIDLMSLRNYIQWLYEQDRLEEARYVKAIRHLDAAIHERKRYLGV